MVLGFKLIKPRTVAALAIPDAAILHRPADGHRPSFVHVDVVAVQLRLAAPKRIPGYLLIGVGVRNLVAYPCLLS